MRHRHLFRSAGAILCAAALILSLAPLTLAADDSPAVSSNRSKEDYTVWGKPVTSYLYENEDGGLTRVEYINGQVVVEDYSSSFQLQSSRTITPELSIWGGFYAGEDYNFLIFGQSNNAESDSAEVIRVVKYDKEWNRLGAASLLGANTTAPFDAGSLRCDEYGGYLYLRTSHEMYTTSDGLNHQANLTMAVRESDMTITDSYYGIMNISYGYVSHSFNQFILVDSDGNIIAADHGDAYPRGVSLVGYYSNASTGKFSSSAYSNWCWSITLKEFGGAVGANATGASVGGLAETANGYVLAFNYNGTGTGSGDRYVYFHYMDKATGKGLQYTLTSSAGSTTPVVAPTGLDGGYVLWNGKSGSTISDTLYYITYDESGVPSYPVQTAAAPLSDCQPIPYGDGIVWYVTDSSAPTFYILDNSGVTACPVEDSQPEITPTAMPSASPSSGAFTDVADSAWYAEYVSTAAQAGLINGVGNQKFNPQGVMSVAEVVTLTARLYAECSGESVPSASGPWYQGAYNYCVAKGLFTAAEVPLSTLEDPATRFQMVDLMDRAVPDSEKQAINTVSDGGVPDVKESDPYGDVVYLWYRAGITEGDQNGRFNGSSQITRAEIATILCRLAGLTPRVGGNDLRPEASTSPTPAPTPSATAAPTPTLTATPDGTYTPPELAFSLPVMTQDVNSTMLITLLDAQRHSITNDPDITWSNETPDILSFDEHNHSIHCLSVGTGRLSASLDGHTASMTVYVVPKGEEVALSTLSLFLSPGGQASTQLYVFDSTRYYGRDYTVQWSVDHPEILTLEETTINGNPAVRFTANEYGDAVITCRVTLSDGTYTEAYCCVGVRP